MIVTGARQVGKTTIVNKFANEKYKNVVYINFMNNKSYKDAFIGDLDVDSIIKSLSFKIKNDFIPYKTVIIFDEIQECQHARSSIKSFMIDGRFDIIATGSLLGIRGYSKTSDISIPVGFEHFLKMSSLDFEEFLWANNINKKQVDLLKNHLINIKKIPESIHIEMNKMFKEYICVGGMPEAVSEFLNNKNINNVREIQKDIIQSYKDDFGKHLNGKGYSYTNKVELAKTLTIFDSIPKQLWKENKKFKFNEAKQNGKFRDFVNNIQWLVDAGIISKCNIINHIEYPLDVYINENSFKLFFNDMGLFLSMIDDEITSLIFNNEIGIYKGYIYESIIADTFYKNKIDLFSYSNKYEIDFLQQVNSKIVPIEVKANDGRSKSLNNIMETNKDKILIGIRIKNKNIGLVNNVITIPHYLAFLIDKKTIKEIIKTNNIS